MILWVAILIKRYNMVKEKHGLLRIVNMVVLNLIAAALMVVVIFLLFYHKPEENNFSDSISIANNSSKTDVEIIIDPICPYCGQLEQESGAKLEKMANNGEINFHYTTVAWFNDYSYDNYSLRAVSAIKYVQNNSDSKSAIKYLNYIMSKDFQPKEGTSYKSVSDGKLQDAMVESKALSKYLANKFDSHDTDLVSWANKVSKDTKARSDIQTKDGGISTPTVLINGKKYDDSNDNTIKELSKGVLSQIEKDNK
jgi:protein-disulfide isomerase